MIKEKKFSLSIGESKQRGYAKTRLQKRLAKLDLEIFDSSGRKKEGGLIHKRKCKRLISIPEFGKFLLERNQYKRKAGDKGEYSILLDQKLGWDSRIRFSPEVRRMVTEMLGRKMTAPDIVQEMKSKQRVKFSKQTVSNIRKESHYGNKKNLAKTKLTKPLLYLNLDETYFKIRVKGRKIRKVRARVVTSYTGEDEDKQKNRKRLLNKKAYVEIYSGNRISSFDYGQRLSHFLLEEYVSDYRKIDLFGATDGCVIMKGIVKKYLSSKFQTIPYLSKFHHSWNLKIRKNRRERYILNNKEGVKNGAHPKAIGYSAEGDIARLFKKSLKGRTFSQASWVNLLRSQGVVVKFYS